MKPYIKDPNCSLVGRVKLAPPPKKRPEESALLLSFDPLVNVVQPQVYSDKKTT